MVKVAQPEAGQELYSGVSFHLTGTNSEGQADVFIMRKGKDSHVQSFLYLPDQCLS